MSRLTVISKNTKIRKIDIVVVHSFDDAFKEAQYAMERGCDEAVVEDEVHNVVLRLIKPKKTNFDRITASPEALAEFIANIPDKLINPLYGVPTVKRVLPWLKEESKE